MQDARLLGVSLGDDLRAIVASRAGTWTVYARHLGSGELVAIRADKMMPAQSSVKVCVLLTYTKKVRLGQDDPRRRVSLKSEDHTLGSGVLRYLAPGLTPTLDDLAWLMIVLSDNIATRALIRELGGSDVINAEMNSLGLPNLRVHGPMEGASYDFTATAHDLAEVYTHLDEHAREILYRRDNVDFLPRRIPHVHDVIDYGLTAPIRVYGKTGSGPAECIDAGLFETDASSWVVAVMAKDLPDLWHRPDDEGPRTLADIGETMYNAWNKRGPSNDGGHA
jgi:beta-lactamase class A